jgi:hypothetical protein
MQAFGYLVPSNQQSKILGVVFDSASFPEHDRKDTPSTRVTVRVVKKAYMYVYVYVLVYIHNIRARSYSGTPLNGHP